VRPFECYVIVGLEDENQIFDEVGENFKRFEEDESMVLSSIRIA
jgi:hypothetical protein